MKIASAAENLRRDLQYAARLLSKNVGFTVTCVLTIALGIGINVSAFTLLNGMALRPLRAPGADSLVAVYQKIEGKTPRSVWGNASLFSYPEYLQYQEQNGVFSGLLAHFQPLRVTTPGVREYLEGDLTTCNYFDVLQSPPAMGRGFAPEECASAGSGAVLVLNDATWRNAFSADPQIVGKTIRMNQRLFTVIGVARPDFRGTELTAPAFWAPLVNADMLNTSDVRPELFLTRENLSWLSVIGRMREGVSISQARASLNVIAARIDARTPGRRTSLIVDTANLIGMPEERTNLLVVSSVILCAIGMVLLIACANLTNIMLARAAARRREIAVRLALGATRGQLISQLLTESFLLSFLGCVLGTYVAVTCSGALLTMLISHLPPDTPRLTLNLTPDIRVYSYCVGLMLLATVLIGLVPALQSTRTDVATALKMENLQSARSGKSTLRNVLVGAQVTTCALLLICAGLLLHGVMRGEHIDPGFDAEHTADVSLDLTRQGYDAATAASVRSDLMSRLRELPEVTAIAEAQNAPLAGRHEEAQVDVGGGSKQILETNRVSAAYFSTLRIPLVRGRSFTVAEVRSDAALAVVPNATAERVWPAQDPIGKVLRWNGKFYEVIGVTADTRSAYLPMVDSAYVYVPLAPREGSAEVIVRFAGGYAGTANTIRQLVRNMDANLVCGVTRIADNGVTWIAPARVSAALATVLGALALVLAAIGIYGTIAYTVSRRVREISIRMVFGARTIDVHKLVLGQALRPVLAGAAIGSVLAVAAAQLLRSLLFGVTTFDPVSYATVVTFLVATAALAAYLPARHAAKIEPVRALHEE